MINVGDLVIHTKPGCRNDQRMGVGGSLVVVKGIKDWLNQPAVRVQTKSDGHLTVAISYLKVVGGRKLISPPGIPEIVIRGGKWV